MHSLSTGFAYCKGSVSTAANLKPTLSDISWIQNTERSGSHVDSIRQLVIVSYDYLPFNIKYSVVAEPTHPHISVWREEGREIHPAWQQTWRSL